MTSILFDFYETYKKITGEEFENGPTEEYINLIKIISGKIEYPIHLFDKDEHVVLWVIYDVEDKEQNQLWYYKNDFSEYEDERDSFYWDEEYPLEELFRKILAKNSTTDFVGAI